MDKISKLYHGSGPGANTRRQAPLVSDPDASVHAQYQQVIATAIAVEQDEEDANNRNAVSIERHVSRLQDQEVIPSTPDTTNEFYEDASDIYPDTPSAGSQIQVDVPSINISQNDLIGYNDTEYEDVPSIKIEDDNRLALYEERTVANLQRQDDADPHAQPPVEETFRAQLDRLRGDERTFFSPPVLPPRPPGLVPLSPRVTTVTDYIIEVGRADLSLVQSRYLSEATRQLHEVCKISELALTHKVNLGNFQSRISCDWFLELLIIPSETPCWTISAILCISGREC